MDMMELHYDRLLERIANLISLEGPLHEVPEAALKLDALDLKLRSWKYEFDRVATTSSRKEYEEVYEHFFEQIAHVLETVDTLFDLVEGCTDRALRAVSSLLPLLEVETEKLNEIEKQLEHTLSVPLPSEQEISPVGSDDTSWESDSDFDISWRPEDYDSPEVMDRLLSIDRTDLASELLRAASLGHSKTIESLLPRMDEEDVKSATDSDGRTALQVAEAMGNSDIVSKILSKGTASSEVPSRPASSLGPTTLDHAQYAPIDAKSLTRLVEQAEDFACVLQDLRVGVPNDTQQDITGMTGAIGELYRLSTILRQLRVAFGSTRYADRLYRIQSDARLVCYSIQSTLDVASGMVSRASPASRHRVWEDLVRRMRDMEQVPLPMRLGWYHNFTQGLLDRLEGNIYDGALTQTKGSIEALFEQQQQQQQQQQQPEHRPNQPDDVPHRVVESSSGGLRVKFDDLNSYTRPRQSANELIESSQATRPTRDGWENTRTYVSSDTNPSRLASSSSYRASSGTSHTSYDLASSHWASHVFDGHIWRSRYHASQQLEAVTRCQGDPQADAKLIVEDEGYFLLTSVHFSDNGSILTFYWRPRDGRARILFTAIDTWGQEVHYCLPLTRLRAFRHKSILKLCMASSSDDHLFWTWAELKFIYHERMVLFYSTFVALKRQDSAGLPVALIEDPRDMEEELLFSGVIRDREMYHVLRLHQDRGSRVIRLEARSYRGDKDEVPIWTAFLTKYRDEGDRDIFDLESRGVVSMICPRPKPYIFVPEYGLPMTSDGNLALQFAEKSGGFNHCYQFELLCRLLTKFSL